MSAVPAESHELSVEDFPGHHRSRVTLPGYRKGVAPGNKGRELPAEILTQDEVARLMDAPWREPLMGARNRAMIALMYRAEVKIGALVKLAIHHWDPATGILRVAGSHGAEDRDVRLDPSCRESLDAWLEKRGDLHLRPIAPMFCTLKGTFGRPMNPATVRETLNDLRERAGIQKRVTPEGLRQSRANHRVSEAGKFEATIAEYVNADSFRRRYPTAHQKWSDAHQLLESAPMRLATPIGHLCRDAVIEFSDDLVRQRALGEFEANKIKSKVRAVFDAQSHLSGTVRDSLEALLAYWETISDLVNRQEHGRLLTAEDSRRIVFQTMLVMREIDAVLR